MEASTQQRQTCYRHPDRETGVSCSNCGRPICPDCMTSPSVGMRCPECARQTTKVRTGAGAFSPTAGKMPATIALIAINVIVFIIELAGGGTGSFSGGGGVIPRAGGGGVAGSLGALIVDPNAVTVGASGAIFGLMAAVVVIARGRGVEQLASQFGLFIVLNLVLTFSISGISVGGHIGGLIGGFVAAALVLFVERQMSGRAGFGLELASIVLIIAATFAGALAVA